MKDTKIKWTNHTWNPASGCTAISEGCAHCYARTLAENKRGTVAFPHGFDLQLRPHRLDEARKLPPGLVFCNSMSDFFQEGFPTDFVDKIMVAITEDKRHIYQLLTKRASRCGDYFRDQAQPENLWVGVTIESDRHLYRLEDIAHLERRFVSVEPMLTPIPPEALAVANWVIVGGESGFHLKRPECSARALTPERANWVRPIRDWCAASRVPFFFKQWSSGRAGTAGDELDGKQYHEFPLEMKPLLFLCPRQ